MATQSLRKRHSSKGETLFFDYVLYCITGYASKK